MLATLLVQYNPDGSLVYQNPYLNTQLVMGRQPFQYVEIDLDYCANTAGVAPVPHHKQVTQSVLTLMQLATIQQTLT